MRNPTGRCDHDVVLKLLDPSDNSFGVAPQQREELALAFVTNPSAIEDSRADHPFEPWMDAGGHYESEKARERFWQLLTKFPSYRVKQIGFSYFGGKDEWKAAAYAATEDPYLRLAIISNTLEMDFRTLELARKDQDEYCREAAQERYIVPGKPKTSGRRIMGHVWTGVSDLAFLVIVLLMFSKTTSAFERLAVVLLVATYLGLTGSLVAVGRLYSHGMAALDVEFRRVRRLAGEKPSLDDRYEEADQAVKIAQTLSKADVDYRIHATFHLLIWCVLAYQVAATLF